MFYLHTISKWSIQNGILDGMYAGRLIRQDETDEFSKANLLV